ncbi:MAG: DUF1254 domain-containing protein [Porphyrobacter sp.]|nr:DUF1254 domain-containing protein [Porphyrobacter sp.]
MPVPVTVDNYVRAETDKVFAAYSQRAFGTFLHYRELAPLDDQNVQRANRDTLYSVSLFDLDAGPVTFTMPDPGQGFMSLTPFSEDHYTTGSVYGPGEHTFSRDDVGTRYALFALRTFVDPNDPADVARAHALQDAVGVRQAAGGTFTVPDWDQVVRQKLADALSVLGATLADWRGASGVAGEVDPIRHLIISATGWGLNLPRDAIYLNVSPERNDGQTVYRLHVREVPVDGFWSVSVYNTEGYFQSNPQDAYSINNITAQKEADGSVTIQFGGCGDGVPNCLPIMPGWNYTVRLYRPRPEILDDTWTFPEAQPVG